MVDAQSSPSIIALADLRGSDTEVAGGKAANLGEMIAAGFPVPGGFVVPAEIYLAAAETAGVRDELVDITHQALSADTEGVAALAARARELVRSTRIEGHVREAMDRALAVLGPDPSVAVRSSATAEDTAETSFAGMNASFTNVTGLEQVAGRVVDCWESLWGDRSVAYRASQQLEAEPAIAVVVQAMVDSEKSGVMFTVDPAHGDDSVLVIEAAFGLGEVVVSGSVEPDTYLVDRASLAPRQLRIGHKAYRLHRGAGGDAREDLTEEQAWHRVLTDEQITEVAEVGVRIEDHYGTPQDIEFAYVGDKLHILQSRPVTTLADPDRTEEPAVLHGLGVGSRSGVGRVRVLHSPKEGHLLQDGEVLVAEMTAPDWLPTLRRSAAIVTDAGGSTCHAAIVSRELGIPGVVGTREATTALRDGDLVTVDAARGAVYRGDRSAKEPSGDRLPAVVAGAAAPTTSLLEGGGPIGTDLYVNLALPDGAEAAAALPVDGVGLLRGELLLTTALEGRHPRQVMAEGGDRAFVDKMSADLSRIAGAFAPRPVVYRTMDFRTNEFSHLAGGDQFEPVEENPMIGYRGCYRYIREPEVFALELQALAETRDQFPNLHMMIPFVRTAWELEACLEAIDHSPLGDQRGLHRWVMAEVPSVIYRIPDYAAMGIDGVSIGSNDLTQLMLGVDRDSAICAELFDESDDAVLWAIERIVNACRDVGITSSLCGQAPSNRPDFAEHLVRFGINSVSVDPDAALATRQVLARAEHRLLLDEARSQSSQVSDT